MSKRKNQYVHKMVKIKVPNGYNPFKPLCGNEDDFVYSASDWKEVKCQKCHMIRGKKIKSPYEDRIIK